MLTVVLMNELMPRALADWQPASRNRLVVVGFCIFVMAWIGAYVGYPSEVKGIQVEPLTRVSRPKLIRRSRRPSLMPGYVQST